MAADTGNARLHIFDIQTWSLEHIIEFADERAPVDVAVVDGMAWVLGEDGRLEAYLMTDPSLGKREFVPSTQSVDPCSRVIVDAGGRVYGLFRSGESESPNRDDAAGAKLVRLDAGPSPAQVQASSTPEPVRSRFRTLGAKFDHQSRFSLVGTSLAGEARGWYSRNGQPLSLRADRWAGEPPRRLTGEWVSKPLDSGIYQCRWHRVIAKADIPPGTRLMMSALTTEEPIPATRAVASGMTSWVSFLDKADNSAEHRIDALLQTNPGRYLSLRIQLVGDGYATPTVEGLKLEYPRRTWLRYLPAVYAKDPDSRDFLERFLSLLQQQVGNVEGWLAEPANLFNLDAAPAAMVAEIAAWLGIELEPEWSDHGNETAHRAIAKAVAGVAGRRGTRAAMQSVLAAYLEQLSSVRTQDLELPVLVEAFRLRSPAVVSLTRVGGGGTLFPDIVSPETSGDASASPKRRAFESEAHRFQIFVPAALLRDSASERVFRRAIDNERPAHTVYELVLVTPGVIVGPQLQVGLSSIIGDGPVTVLARCEGDDGPPGEHRSRLGIDTVIGRHATATAELRPEMFVGEQIR